MPYTYDCSACGAELNLRTAVADGRRLNCPQCGGALDERTAAGPLPESQVNPYASPLQSSEPPPEGTLWATRRRHAFDQMTAGAASKVLEAVFDISTARGKSPAQAAMNWVLSKPEITVAISGADTAKQLDDVLGALDWELSPEEIKRLDEASSPMGTVLDAPGIERRDSTNAP